uniref:Peptidase C1A papain C-terminal domain-containing protein n=1 Tax=Panagrolaimus sp. PS1159 TaxID=55785 RepID=A0AC35FXU2_9BILA
MVEEPESSSLHRMPSDSEVIIATETDGTGTRHKVVIPAAMTPRSLFKKPRLNTSRFPFLMICVICCGLLLLFIILIATSAETWFSSGGGGGIDRSTDYDDGEELQEHEIVFVKHTASDERYHRAIVNDVNRKQGSWKAVYNKYASKSQSSGLLSDPESQKVFYIRNIVTNENSTFSELMGDTILQQKKLAKMNINLPKRFDAREKWPFCESVHRVMNQGGCGSCYAVAAAAVMSDRICIESNGIEQPFISAQDLISCCPNCGGCHGTVWALLSFNYWRDHGIVSGGSYGSYEGCKPYAQPPNCGSPCSIDIYSKKDHDHMKCRRQCQNHFSKEYDDDLYRAKSVYWVKVNKVTVSNMDMLKAALNVTTESNEVIIKREIITNGPVLACFVVYEEFQHYKSGIYKAQTSALSKDLYGHCAKLIGWGETENGQKYWQFMNTWGRSNWGENGFFRMADEPEEVAAGIPTI